MQQYLNFMVDFETLSHRPHEAVVINLTIVPFQLGENAPLATMKDGLPDAFTVNISASSCKELGLQSSNSTVDFWARDENNEVYRQLTKDTVPVRDAFMMANNYLAKHMLPADESQDVLASRYAGCEFWACGPEFDFTIWNKICDLLGQESPFPHWGAMSVRNTKRLLKMVKATSGVDVADNVYKEFEAHGYTKHDPVSDCLYQIRLVQEEVNILGQIDWEKVGTDYESFHVGVEEGVIVEEDDG